jgi:hypothetical protein
MLLERITGQAADIAPREFESSFKIVARGSSARAKATISQN